MTARRSERYRLVLTRQFRKELKKLSRQNQVRVRRAIPAIHADPLAGRKLARAKIGQYRWRIGDLRVLYDMEGRDIVLLHVKKREDAYRKT